MTALPIVRANPLKSGTLELEDVQFEDLDLWEEKTLVSMVLADLEDEDECNKPSADDGWKIVLSHTDYCPYPRDHKVCSCPDGVGPKANLWKIVYGKHVN
jgi:hypothetical protein